MTRLNYEEHPTRDWKKLFPGPVAVLGYGLEGQSTLRHLVKHGFDDIIVLDKNAPAEALPAGVRGIFGPDYLRGLEPEYGVRTAFRAPGVRPLVPEIEAFIARGGRLTSQVEAAFTLHGRHRIIGVTGTVGKGTCCSLLSAMLESAGIAHRLAGNIGLPPFDALEGMRPDTWLLLELSSFQLSTLRESPTAAVVLRTTTEHLDWHATRDEYWDHKANLVRFQDGGDFCAFFAGAEGSAWIGTLGAGRKIPILETVEAVESGALSKGTEGTEGTEGTAEPAEGAVRLTASEVIWENTAQRLHLSETSMTGAFNLENVAAAAVAALELGASFEAVREGARDFVPLEHRIEFVRELGGIRYYNDSYATRPEAALAAVRAFRKQGKPDNGPSAPLGLILGGSEKFADFSEMAAALKDEEHLRAIAFIGQTAERLETELRAAGALDPETGRAWRRCETLEEALDFLRGAITEGVILLSPACASFGLFANYKERGKAFKRLVGGV